MRLFSVGEVTLSKDDPLSVDLTMVPDRPTATKVLFAKVTPKRLFEVGEVALSQDDPLSVDLTMVPDRPTATNIPEPEELSDVVVVVVVVDVVVEVVHTVDDIDTGDPTKLALFATGECTQADPQNVCFKEFASRNISCMPMTRDTSQ
jgi:hypothetical protein